MAGIASYFTVTVFSTILAVIFIFLIATGGTPGGRLWNASVLWNVG